MRKMFISAVLLLPVSLKAQDLPPGLPGLPLAPVVAEAAIAQRPDALLVLADLAPDLRLSMAQEERITKLVDRKAKEFDELSEEYARVSAEEKKWNYKANELKYKMKRINRSIPDGIRDYLDDDQRQRFDAIIEAKRNPVPATTTVVPAKASKGAPAATTPKHLKKRRRVIRRKRRPSSGSRVKRKRVLRRKAVPSGRAGSAPANKAPTRNVEVGSYP